MMSGVNLSKVAHRMADVAGEVVLSYFRNPDLVSVNKLAGGFDPVTEADRAAERAMREILQTERPDDAIYGEEFGKTDGRSGLTWVLDPIDGTRSFISGVPMWGILISVLDGTGPIYGLIDQPYLGERYEGGAGIAKLTSRDGAQTLCSRANRPLADAILFSTMPNIGTEVETAAFNDVSGQVRLTRFGTDCYAYALLAAGHIDLVIEAGLQPYDICAPIAVIEAAGGIITNWQGGAAHDGGRVLAAANREQHEAALEILSRY